VPCTTKASVALTFGKQEFTIDSRDLAFTPVDPADPEGDCISGISAGNIGGATEWLVSTRYVLAFIARLLTCLYFRLGMSS